MNSFLERINNRIEPLRRQIISHPVYAAIGSVAELNVFMQHHVYAVWDFMSLLKALQNNLTCTSVPWFPKGAADTRYLINEIVVGEESDVDEAGKRTSHFELYLKAMQQSGADTAPVNRFITSLQQNGDLDAAFQVSGAPQAAQDFVRFTFGVIGSNQPHLQAAVFTFGREDLIPDMFHAIVTDLNQRHPERISVFNYYLARHIEVDGGHHSHLALDMLARLCGTDEQRWEEAEEMTVAALQKRVSLWDGVYRQIRQRQPQTVV